MNFVIAQKDLSGSDVVKAAGLAFGSVREQERERASAAERKNER